MARKRIKDLRVEHEIAERRKAEAGEEAAPKTKKKTKRKAATKKKRKTTTSRAKKVTATRRRLMWAVYSGSMKEEGRYEYHEKAQAEEKLEALRAKSKKQLYFIQPIKVPIAGEEIVEESDEIDEEEVKAETSEDQDEEE